MNAALEVIRLILRFDARGFRRVVAAAGVGALIDVAGIASIAPFLSLVSNPDVIYDNEYLNFVFISLEYENDRSFLIFVGAATIIVLFIFAVIRALIEYRVIYFINWQRHIISSTIFKKGFYDQEALIGDQHSAVLTSQVFGETDVFIDSAVRPLIELIVNGLLLSAVLSLLIFLNPLSTVSILGFLAVFFGGAILATRRLILQSGKQRAQANVERYKYLNEALSGALELQLLGRESLYIKRFCDASERFARAVARNLAVLQISTYAVQAVAFGGIIALTIVLLRGGEEIGAIIPTLGIFLFAGYRVMPAANNCYRATSTLRYAQPAIHTIRGCLQDCHQPTLPNAITQEQTNQRLFEGPVQIRMEEVFYSYGNGGAHILIDSMSLPAGKTIGIVGPSGSGKSTLFSLLIGLRKPQTGEILIDGYVLDSTCMRHWHDAIGFVSQRPFFPDDTIAANIALGLPENDRDQNAIKAAARLANAEEFIVQLPEGYSARVGENGNKLSGGQRQRLAIARALYHDPSVLFLDEITSSLDQRAESVISNTIANMAGKRTIFIIAHRPGMLEICDIIVRLDKGKISDYGPADEVIKNRDFKMSVQK